jgi:hypothetical protein
MRYLTIKSKWLETILALVFLTAGTIVILMFSPDWGPIGYLSGVILLILGFGSASRVFGKRNDCDHSPHWTNYSPQRFEDSHDGGNGDSN